MLFVSPPMHFPVKRETTLQVEAQVADRRDTISWRPPAALAGAGLIILVPTDAFAHVKWFAPFVVGASPAPVIDTLTNGWFWLAIALVLAFFTITVLVERLPLISRMTAELDRFTAPLWSRADDFMRAIVAAFFVAIFAVGGIYLTPDLQTPNEWVSWLQLLIAVLVFSQRTMPLAAAGFIGLWVIALRDYDLFHLLDYLALGVGVAGYLALAAFPSSRWYTQRFLVLRWGVAIALMWSSLEKLAYPDWFYPLVEERPFLTFGLPRDPFIPMAGVAEFTMGFGLLWTPLVRRLSAVALLIIFVAAVYPFGRIDLVGHALIMGALLVIVADPARPMPAPTVSWRAVRTVPLGLFAALVAVGGAYWGLHAALYAGPDGASPSRERSTHVPNLEHPHNQPPSPPFDSADPQ